MARPLRTVLAIVLLGIAAASCPADGATPQPTPTAPARTERTP